MSLRETDAGQQAENEDAVEPAGQGAIGGGASVTVLSTAATEQLRGLQATGAGMVRG